MVADTRAWIPLQAVGRWPGAAVTVIRNWVFRFWGSSSGKDDTGFTWSKRSCWESIEMKKDLAKPLASDQSLIFSFTYLHLYSHM